MSMTLADELREHTAMRYVGDCKCGACQLVPRELIDRVIVALQPAPLAVNQQSPALVLSPDNFDQVLADALAGMNAGEVVAATTQTGDEF